MISNGKYCHPLCYSVKGGRILVRLVEMLSMINWVNQTSDNENFYQNLQNFQMSFLNQYRKFKNLFQKISEFVWLNLIRNHSQNNVRKHKCSKKKI